MAGLYLHIPFCKQACHYCNFHFSTNLSQKEAMVEAICRELILQKKYLDGAKLDTIYFGGGTPSLLTIKELNNIFNVIRANFDWHENAEITLEANPDDLDFGKINDLKNYTPINRFSIGIQSFFEEDLRWMNRAHSASEARKCLENALAAGFDNLSIDLIYGSPTTTSAIWDANLDIAFSYPIPHLSCYALTVETGTALAHFVKKKTHVPPDDDATIQQFDRLIERSSAAGFEHYEISNFAKTGFRAQHNSNYWLGEPYLGVGPAAHSFNKSTRHGNIANNVAYLKNLASQKLAFELEILTPNILYNEYVLTRLRTVWGCRLADLEAMDVHFAAHFLREIDPFLADGSVVLENEIYFLSKKGKFLADRIAMDLFV